MRIDFEKIAEENVRKYGTDIDKYGPVLLANLYSDRTHFIYELLQNAEDAGATSVTFSLFQDRLEFRHDGRDFDKRDVRGICGLVAGTKTDDAMQIGKFGIGFKSVYAYTNSPEIHNGAQHFCIQNYVIPKELPGRHAGKGMTLFIFPFDHPNVSAREAFSEIHERLKQLGLKTLLFLKNLTSVDWRVNGKSKGSYRRASRGKGQVQYVNLSAKGDSEETIEKWLVFRRPINKDESIHEHVPCVEIAYLLRGDKAGRAHISRPPESPLSVFFPTEKETNLGFLIQGPYVTTPARDNVPERHAHNVDLVNETALLVEESLFALKDKDKLSVETLEAMPLVESDFPENSMFRPIFTAVRKALLHKELLPALGGSYVAGKDAKLARGGEMAERFNPKRLQRLLDLDRTPKWLSTDISPNKTPDLYIYLVGRTGRGRYHDDGIEPLVGNIEVRPEDLLPRLNEKFMSEQPDAWVKRLYIYLGTQRDLYSTLRRLPILRLKDGSHVAAQSEDGQPTAFLPSKQAKEFPTVKPNLIGDPRIMDFLRDLGLQEPDVAAELMQRVLVKYGAKSPPVGQKEHREDIKSIVSTLKSGESHHYKLQDALRSTAFLRAENAGTKKRNYRRPNEIYNPTEELKAFFEDNSEAWFLCEAIEHTDLWLDLGLRNEVEVVCRKPGRDGHVVLAAEARNHRRGLEGFDPDCTIFGLEHALQCITVDKARFIWNRLLLPNARAIRGVVESALWSTYKRPDIENTCSAMGRLVIDREWLPDKDRSFRRPNEMSTDDLLPGFEINELLVKQLGMRPAGLVSLSEQTKISIEHLDLLRKRPELFEEFMKWRKTRPPEESEEEDRFPSGPVSGPGDREEKKAAAHAEETEIQYEGRERSTRVSKDPEAARTYLGAMYPKGQNSMCCQLCQLSLDDSSFRKRDGKPYFEAVEIFPKDHLAKEDNAAYVLLCPLCAAKYKELVKKQRGQDSQLEQLKQRLLEVDPANVDEEKLKVELELNGTTGTLRFVGKHWSDLRAILRQES